MTPTRKGPGRLVRAATGAKENCSVNIYAKGKSQNAYTTTQH